MCYIFRFFFPSFRSPAELSHPLLYILVKGQKTNVTCDMFLSSHLIMHHLLSMSTNDVKKRKKKKGKESKVEKIRT